MCPCKNTVFYISVLYIKCRLYQFPNTQKYVRGSHQLLPVVHLFSSQLLSGCGPPSGSVCGSGPGFQSVRKLPGHHRGADHSQPLPEQLYIWYVINQVVCLSVHLSFCASLSLSLICTLPNIPDLEGMLLFVCFC